MWQGAPPRSGLHVCLTYFVCWQDDIWCWRHPGARGERRSCKQTHVWRERTVKKMLNNPSLVLSEVENWLPGKRVSLWPPLISRTSVANGDVTFYRGKIGCRLLSDLGASIILTPRITVLEGSMLPLACCVLIAGGNPQPLCSNVSTLLKYVCLNFKSHGWLLFLTPVCKISPPNNQFVLAISFLANWH